MKNTKITNVIERNYYTPIFQVMDPKSAGWMASTTEEVNTTFRFIVLKYYADLYFTIVKYKKKCKDNHCNRDYSMLIRNNFSKTIGYYVLFVFLKNHNVFINCL